jgi:hypothetical protein
MANFHHPDEFNHSVVQRYPLRSDPDAVLVSLLITNRRSRIIPWPPSLSESESPLQCV